MSSSIPERMKKKIELCHAQLLRCNYAVGERSSLSVGTDASVQVHCSDYSRVIADLLNFSRRTTNRNLPEEVVDSIITKVSITET